MKLSSIKHNIKWNSWIGEKYRNLNTCLGLWFLKVGRSFLKTSLGRCSYCGEDCGMNSSISRKGKRCSYLNKDCERMP